MVVLVAYPRRFSQFVGLEARALAPEANSMLYMIPLGKVPEAGAATARDQIPPHQFAIYLFVEKNFVFVVQSLMARVTDGYQQSVGVVPRKSTDDVVFVVNM